jgi:hypothetical protein
MSNRPAVDCKLSLYQTSADVVTLYVVAKPNSISSQVRQVILPKNTRFGSCPELPFLRLNSSSLFTWIFFIYKELKLTAIIMEAIVCA